jgi:hypothetical protein
MKKLLFASIIAALGAATFASQTARAGDEEVLAAIGGFIGGVIVGSQANHHACPPPVVADCAPRPEVGVAVTFGSYRQAPRGYWEWVTVRTWVPGRWVVAYDGCGRRVHSFERGRYEHRRERVWVEAGDGHYRHGHRD